MRFLRRIWRLIFGYEQWQDQSDGTGSVFHDRTPESKTEAIDAGKYNRDRRRNGSFVVIDKRTELYLQQIRSGKRNAYLVVELEEATTWPYNKLTNVINDALSTRGNLDLTYECVYRDEDGERKTL